MTGIEPEPEDKSAMPAGMTKAAPAPSPDEWDEVRRSLQTLSTRTRLVDLDARASAIGHELRQPLFTIAMATENLRLTLDAPEIAKAEIQAAVERIAEQVERAQTIITQILDQHAKAGAPSGPVDPAQAANNAIRFLEGLLDTIDVTVSGHEAGALVSMDAIQMEQVFVNVMRNAAESIAARRRTGWSGEGRMTIRFDTEGGRLRCRISDNGAGFAEGMEGTRFRPFVTTKGSEGTGLGLHICERILAAADGTIRLYRGETEGAEVELMLPLTSATPQSGRAVA